MKIIGRSRTAAIAEALARTPQKNKVLPRVTNEELAKRREVYMAARGQLTSVVKFSADVREQARLQAIFGYIDEVLVPEIEFLQVQAAGPVSPGRFLATLLWNTPDRSLVVSRADHEGVPPAVELETVVDDKAGTWTYRVVSGEGNDPTAEPPADQPEPS